MKRVSKKHSIFNLLTLSEKSVNLPQILLFIRSQNILLEGRGVVLKFNLKLVNDSIKKQIRLKVLECLGVSTLSGAKPETKQNTIPSVELTNFLWLKYELGSFLLKISITLSKGFCWHCQVAPAVGSCLDTTFGYQQRQKNSIIKQAERIRTRISHCVVVNTRDPRMI